MDSRIYNWLLFLMNPFVSMIIAFKNMTLPYTRDIFWGFCTFYGLTFAIGSESSSSDITRYVLELVQLHDQPFFTLKDAFEYFLQSGEIDIVRTLLSYIISRFTGSQVVLTTVYGFIFGYFFSRNIWYIFNLLKRKITFLEKFLLLALILVVPIWFLNGFRMYTAFHVFMFGLLPYIFEGKKKGLIFVFLSFLVHFALMIPIGLVLIYVIFGNQLKIYFIIFAVSIFITELDLGSINQYIEIYAPAIIDERTSSYRAEDQVSLIRENIENNNRAWYVTLHRELLNWSLIVLLFYFFIIANPKIKFILAWKKLFSITLIIYAGANLLSNVPSGARFLSFAFFLTLIMIILYLHQFRNDSKIRGLIYLLSPAFLLFIIVSIRLGLYGTSISTIVGNPITSLFLAGDTISLNDLIK